MEGMTYSVKWQIKVRPDLRIIAYSANNCRKLQLEYIPRLIGPIMGRVALTSTRSWVVRNRERLGKVDPTSALGFRTSDEQNLQRR